MWCKKQTGGAKYVDPPIPQYKNMEEDQKIPNYNDSTKIIQAYSEFDIKSETYVPSITLDNLSDANENILVVNPHKSKKNHYKIDKQPFQEEKINEVKVKELNNDIKQSGDQTEKHNKI